VDAKTGNMVPELCGDEMSVEMTKFYRTTCFQDIGGFVRQVMWDGIDCHRCRMLGWIAESRDFPNGNVRPQSFLSSQCRNFGGSRIPTRVSEIPRDKCSERVVG
jgi:hypothetical protein